MDLDVLISYFPRYIEAFFLTVRIGAFGILIAFFIGIEEIFTKHNLIQAAKKVGKKKSVGIDGISAKESIRIINDNYDEIYKLLIKIKRIAAFWRGYPLFFVEMRLNLWTFKHTSVIISS